MSQLPTDQQIQDAEYEHEAPQQGGALARRPEPQQFEITLTPKRVKERLDAIQQMMDECMKVDVDYGTVPGCGDKPTILKPGAEKLGLMFGLTAELQSSERELGNGHREYRVKCTLVHRGSGGIVVKDYPGVCSTMEGKYRYRRGAPVLTDRPVPSAYWDARNSKDLDDKTKFQRMTEALGGRQFTVAKNDAGAWVIAQKSEDKVEHDNPADYYNTCAKIAAKRAYHGAILTATGASSFFTTDIEDDPELFQHGGGQQNQQQAQSRNQGQSRQQGQQQQQPRQNQQQQNNGQPQSRNTNPPQQQQQHGNQGQSRNAGGNGSTTRNQQPRQNQQQQEPPPPPWPVDGVVNPEQFAPGRLHSVFYVVDTTEKTGTNNRTNKPYTLYGIICAELDQATNEPFQLKTFSKTSVETAEKFMREGTPAWMIFTDSEWNGRIQHDLIEIREAPPQPQASATGPATVAAQSTQPDPAITNEEAPF